MGDLGMVGVGILLPLWAEAGHGGDLGYGRRGGRTQVHWWPVWGAWPGADDVMAYLHHPNIEIRLLLSHDGSGP